MDAGVAAEPAVGRHHVGRVAGQEDPARLVALGHVGGGHPLRDVVDLHGKVRHPDGGLDEPGGLLGGELPGDVQGAGHGGISQRVDDEESRCPGPLESEEAAHGRVGDVADAEFGPGEELTAVGAEVDRRAAGELAVPAHPDPKLPADRAAVAVGGDDVPAPHPLDRAGCAVSDGGGDAVVVLVQGNDLGVVAQRRPEALGADAQQRLKRVLRDEHPAGRAELGHPVIEVRDKGRDLPFGQRADLVDAAVREVPLGREPLQWQLEPDRAHQLERA